MGYKTKVSAGIPVTIRRGGTVARRRTGGRVPVYERGENPDARRSSVARAPQPELPMHLGLAKAWRGADLRMVLLPASGEHQTSQRLVSFELELEAEGPTGRVSRE